MICVHWIKIMLFTFTMHSCHCSFGIRSKIWTNQHRSLIQWMKMSWHRLTLIIIRWIVFCATTQPPCSQVTVTREHLHKERTTSASFSALRPLTFSYVWTWHTAWSTQCSLEVGILVAWLNFAGIMMHSSQCHRLDANKTEIRVEMRTRPST